MLKNYYILLIKDEKKIINLYHQNIYFFKIKHSKENTFLYVDEDNYQKCLRYFKIYDISLYKINGLNKYKQLLKRYAVFITSVFLALLTIILLSNIIFEVNIMTDNDELKNIIINELNTYGISKYNFQKSYSEKEIIKKRILNDYKDKIEWLEIDRIGTKYYIYVLERRRDNKNNDNAYRNIISKKNAVILNIKSSKGEIVKKINDYVNKGEIVISGKIMKNDEVKEMVRADGSVYGETWYNVKVELPHSYQEKNYTGNYYHTYILSVFDKKISFFKNDKYSNREYVDKIILGNNILPIYLSKSKVLEVNNSINFYTYDTALEKGMTIAREKLENNLSDGAKIISQKKLKLYEENNIIIVEVFFKVYENITDYENILEEGE